MTLLDSKLVRCWTSRPHLQSLYTLAAAAPRMRAALGLAPTGGGTVGFQVDGDALARTEAELIAATSARLPVHPLVTQDLHGRSTVRCWRRNRDLRVLTADLVDVADRLARAGYGGCLRSASVEFAEPPDAATASSRWCTCSTAARSTPRPPPAPRRWTARWSCAPAPR